MHDIEFHNTYLMDPLDQAVADRISPTPITDIYSSALGQSYPEEESICNITHLMESDEHVQCTCVYFY